MIYIGLAIGGLFIAPMTDVWGKKWMLLTALFVLLFIFVAILYA